MLGRIIELVNWLPPKIPKPPPETPQPPTLSRVLLGPGRGAPITVKEVRDSWVHFVKQFPVPVRKYLGPIRADTIQRAKWSYNSLVQAGEVLRFIAQGNQTKSLLENGKYLPMGTFVKVDEGGRIEFQKNPTFSVLEGVEADRIRECLVCDKIFWAGRKDKKCCSPRCLKVWHTRRWREKYPENYKWPRYRRRWREKHPDRYKPQR
ncbi:MAG: hypothetical protein HY313_04130 [Acidobacteria bacterium]|nr:hypothetical protein [Acidobacteriota bacterium]